MATVQKGSWRAISAKDNYFGFSTFSSSVSWRNDQYNVTPPTKRNKVGRPTKLSYSFESPTSSSSSLPSLHYSPTNRTDSSLPLDVSRYDRINHLPKMDLLKNATKCKNSPCSRNNRTHFYCTKCNVHLCLTKDRNCFAEFHKKKLDFHYNLTTSCILNI